MLKSGHRRSVDGIERPLARFRAYLLQRLRYAHEKPSRHRVESHFTPTTRNLHMQFDG